MDRPYTFINVAMTADGKIDTFERKGASISSARDKQRVDELRAKADGILVGGRTLLEEDPKLTVKSESLRAERMARGLPPNPAGIGVATVAMLDPGSEFLTAGPARVVIFTTERTSEEQVANLRARGVEVYVHDRERIDLIVMMRTMKRMGIDRLMVEGGGTMNFELIRVGLVDEISVYVAPMIFGGSDAPTLADGLGFPRDAAVSLQLKNVDQLEDGGVVLRYTL
ncbi:MAG: 2,5-diamino-6-(ribosylamino)-4(3H)-pyrimidinone 5'-phosphate reductase [Chloroflexi bacterium]|nr:2,5-diamino-6-(ribosylamino)-4(3H)-pyrimidinone 5'-phosphate reductase [Chloroflexota bacterium]